MIIYADHYLCTAAELQTLPSASYCSCAALCYLLLLLLLLSVVIVIVFIVAVVVFFCFFYKHFIVILLMRCAVLIVIIVVVVCWICIVCLCQESFHLRNTCVDFSTLCSLTCVGFSPLCAHSPVLVAKIISKEVALLLVLIVLDLLQGADY